MIEEQRTNLVTYSEDFANVAWGKFGTTITANTIIAPDGTLTADKLVEDTSTSEHRVLEIDSLGGSVDNTNYVCSVYAKAGERTKIRLKENGGNSGSNLTFDLSNGTISGGSNGTITDVGNGWYRCSMLRTISYSISFNFQIILVDGINTTYTGDGYSGVYLWGVQVERGSFPTSYIKTTGSQVTRSKDDVEMTDISWFNFEQGTLYAEVKQNVERNNYNYFRLDDGSTGNFLSIGTKITSPDAIKITTRFNGNTATEFYGSTEGNANNIKAVGTYFNTSFAISANGETATTGTGNPIPPSLNRVIFGDATTVNSAYFKRLAYYPVALTNNEIQDLSEE